MTPLPQDWAPLIFAVANGWHWGPEAFLDLTIPLYLALCNQGKPPPSTDPTFHDTKVLQAYYEAKRNGGEDHQL